MSRDALHNAPDMRVTSQTRVPCAPEFAPVDRQIGWIVINRFTYRIWRMLERFKRPKPDMTGVKISDLPQAGRDCLLVTPNDRRGAGAVMLIHGGGYVTGSSHAARPLAADYARALGVPVLCPGYALGPEAPFPAGHNELLATWHWLQINAASLQIDPTRIAIAGQSAGGGMAAGLVQHIHDQGGTQPAAQVLIYPMLDDRVAGRRELDQPRHRVWSNRNNRFGWTSYLGHAPGAAPVTYAVPGRAADVTGLPPVWIGVGTSDLFLDEDRAYAAALTAQGVAVTYVEVPGAIHAFDAGPTPTAHAFRRAQTTFMQPFVA